MDHPESGVRMQFGDQEILVPPLVFSSIELAWPAIERLKVSVGVVQETAACLDIVVAALSVAYEQTAGDPHMPRMKLARQLRGDQMADLVKGTIELLRVSGLIPKGEETAPATAGVEAAPSTEIAPPSSPSLSATA